MRRRILAAVLAGVAAGAAGAAVQADEPPDVPASTARQSEPPAVPIAPIRDRSRLPDGRYDPSRVHYRLRRERIALTVPDPAGGPSWAVKVFDADRFTIRRPQRTLRGALRVGRIRCGQLGRVHDGRVGWVFGDGRFRRTLLEDHLLECTSRKRPELTASFETTLTIEDPAAPRLAGTVVWGLAPRGGPVTVAGMPGADGAATVQRG
ncbi:MAG TPA: hypothetical protein VGW10_14380, partial [Solirubrobacteraceae bacterium]|nr:hypothetical protein [Solirubrobacteraceae bacterium]